MKMDLKKIPKEAQSLISASLYINNFTRAIEELIYNSLDANCTSIAIRVSIQENFIQIIDNGYGIKKENFSLLGQKYTSTKYIDVCTLKSAPNKYGYCGLSLASIVDISQSVLITSRHSESDSTWQKIFHTGTEKEICVAPTRPSKGTTVEIRGFLYNLTIQRKSIDPIHELQSIKMSLEQLSLIHCNVSISLRDEYKNEIIFKMHKNRDVYQTLWSLFEINREDIQELQVEKNHYKVKAFIAKENILKNIKLNNQWVYLNGKFVSKTEIHKIINREFNNLLLKQNKIKKIKNKTGEEYKSDVPFYFIFISCPFYDFDIIYKHKQTLVEFKDWSEIKKLIEKLIQFYCGEVKLKESFKHGIDNKCYIDNTKMQVKQIVDRLLKNNVEESAVNIQHGVKGNRIKRKRKKKTQNLKNYSPLKFQKLDTSVSRNPNSREKAVTKNIKIKNLEPKVILKTLPNDVKKKNTSRNKVKKKLKYIDPILDKFKNITNSVKERNKILSAEARNLLRIKKPETQTINITYTTKYGSYSYSEVKNKFKMDYRFVSKTDIIDNIYRNNTDVAEPLKSYDLIKPFNQTYNPIYFRTPQTQTMQLSQSVHHAFNFKSYKSSHPGNTFDSHKYQNYPEAKKIITKHLSTNSRHDVVLHENIQSMTEKESYKNKANYENKKISYTIGNTTNVKIRIINSYLNKHSDDENNLDKIILSDLIDRQSLNKSNFKITFDKHIFQNKGNNGLNVTYPVVTNYLSEKDQFDLISISKESFVNNCTENGENITEEKLIEEIHNNKKLSQSLDPLNYCETIFLSNEMAEEFMMSFSNHSDKIGSTELDLPVHNHNADLNPNLLNNENIEDKHSISGDVNVNLNSELPTQQNEVQELNTFQMKKRHDLMPKGMSQIFKTRLCKKTNVSVLGIDYYANTMYDKFAEDVLVNSKIFAPSIQNIEVNLRKLKKCDSKNDNLIFNTLSLKEAKIFGQIDRKFIATQMKGTTSGLNINFLVLFDQHAVDERVKLETNLADYFDGKSWHGVKLDSLPLKLDKNEIQNLHNYKHKFSQFGLQWTLQDDRIFINSIPKAIIGKNAREEQIVVRAIHRLISEQIDVIKMLGGNVTLYPKAIMELVFSEACRHAIKFGDKLSKSDCIAMLKLLSSCKTPFQCAHGRPVMAVLMELPANIRNYRVDMEKIKQFKLRNCF